MDVERIKTFEQLRLAFESWAGRKWIPTPKQLEALRVEWGKLGFVSVQEYRKRANEIRLDTYELYRLRSETRHWLNLWRWWRRKEYYERYRESLSEEVSMARFIKEQIEALKRLRVRRR